MSTQNVECVIGRIVTDGDYRQLFFDDVEEAIAGYELNPVESDTLRRMSDCPVTRMGTAMVNKTHGKHHAAARKAVPATN